MLSRIRNTWRNVKQSAAARHDGRVLVALREFLLSFLRSGLTSGNIGLRALAIFFFSVLLSLVSILRLLRFIVEKIYRVIRSILRTFRIVLAAVFSFLARQWNRVREQGSLLVDILNSMSQRLQKRLASESELLVAIKREEMPLSSPVEAEDDRPVDTWTSLLGGAIGRAFLWAMSFLWAGLVSIVILIAVPGCLALLILSTSGRQIDSGRPSIKMQEIVAPSQLPNPPPERESPKGKKPVKLR